MKTFIVQIKLKKRIQTVSILHRAQCALCVKGYAKKVADTGFPFGKYGWI